MITDVGLVIGRAEVFAAVAQMTLIRDSDLDRLHYCQQLLRCHKYERLRGFLEQWHPTSPPNIVAACEQLSRTRAQVLQALSEANHVYRRSPDSGMASPSFFVGQVVRYKGEPCTFLPMI